jgi:hypothetical protein
MFESPLSRVDSSGPQLSKFRLQSLRTEEYPAFSESMVDESKFDESTIGESKVKFVDW